MYLLVFITHFRVFPQRSCAFMFHQFHYVRILYVDFYVDLINLADKLASILQGIFLLLLSFPAHQAPTEEGSTLKGKNFLLMGLDYVSFQKGALIG